MGTAPPIRPFRAFITDEDYGVPVPRVEILQSGRVG